MLIDVSDTDKEDVCPLLVMLYQCKLFTQT